ncbi:hypothetical protein LPTSP4_09420 [Leptospira ryugenii]|uniref:Uncharacterized protein n=1 Tax=Leptospira ryugenii TaxID=1917863 RepID=A0A2P2DXS5_9LEPT|nr:hypothetical protein [Leptospira ryugenii]GBF49429.1 hypothetical protein LPTSP4_09420 [Leptospira ryugenii]
MKKNLNTLTMNIKRDWFASILSIPQRKKIEYRTMSDYWLTRLEKVGKPPFKLRLLNGMLPPVPEATIIVTKVMKNKKNRELEFHLGKILEVKYWDQQREKPKKNK